MAFFIAKKMSTFKIYLFILLFLFASFSFGFLIGILNNKLIDFSILEYNPNKPSILLDDEGNEWGRFELDKRGYTKFEKIPKHLIDAFVAAEDRNFFKHLGISWKGIIRSIFVNLRHVKKIQGASTITQQLIRLLFFDSKKTFKRKLKEQCFALLVENQFSKEQILEMYLNYIYFGCGIYGVEAASQRFFSKSIQEISIGEAALLAGIVKSPLNYCPLICPESSKKRRNLILSIMYDLGYIKYEDLQKEKTGELKFLNSNQNLACHLKETIRIFLEEKFGKQKVYSSGFKIQTTINSKIQKIAEEEFKKQFINLKKELCEDVDGALISMDSKTGEIKAVVGGFNFLSSKFNRAFQAKRQIGSLFKPIIYALAVENGISFADTEIDEPIEIEFGNSKWKPNNNTRNFEGKMTLARALSFSNNIIAIKVLLKIGCHNAVKLAKKFRFADQLNPYPSLALGCIDVTLKESIGAFNVFANDGVYIEPHYLKWIKNEQGLKIWKCNPEKEPIISSVVSSQVAKVLTLSVKRYIDKLENKTFKCEAIGKTGTTNKSRTCWFCGSTPNLTTSIYIGCDNPKSMGENIYAVKTVFPIWLALNDRINIDKINFSYDPSLKETTIDSFTGEKSSDPDNPNKVTIFCSK